MFLITSIFGGVRDFRVVWIYLSRIQEDLMYVENT